MKILTISAAAAIFFAITGCNKSAVPIEDAPVSPSFSIAEASIHGLYAKCDVKNTSACDDNLYLSRNTLVGNNIKQHVRYLLIKDALGESNKDLLTIDGKPSLKNINATFVTLVSRDHFFLHPISEVRMVELSMGSRSSNTALFATSKLMLEEASKLAKD